MGMLLGVVAHPAASQDRDGAKLGLAKLVGAFPRLGLRWADGGDAGKLVDWARAPGGWTRERVQRPAEAQGFVVLPRRGVGERTFAWRGRSRRLSKDDEALTVTGEAWLRIAMIHLMLKRLAPS